MIEQLGNSALAPIAPVGVERSIAGGMHDLVSFVLSDSKHISRAIVGDVVIHDSAEIMSCGVCLGVRTASVNPLAWYSSTRWPAALLGAFDSADRYAAYRQRLG